jgi:hypothetical protein
MPSMTDSSGGPAVRPPSVSLGSAEAEEQLRQLIRDAFEAARRGGRADWRQMSIAVLKNRLLTLTNRSFNEADYGQRTITDLVRLLPDMLILNTSTRPPTVRLRTADEPPRANHVATTAVRIRRDLWNAIVDYRSGKRYRWDGSSALPEGDTSSDDKSRFPQLPTLSEVEIDQWRTQFLVENMPLVAHDPALIAQAERWRDSRLRTADLPDVLRGRWNARLKELVFVRAVDWFDSHSIPQPADLLQPTGPPAGRRTEASDTEALRELIIRCVRAMTDAELRELRLPPTAMLRARL